jgi:hypothetical protein
MTSNKNKIRVIKLGDKVIGTILDGKFRKIISKASQLYIKLGGIPAIDADTWDKYKDGITMIMVIMFTGEMWTISSDDFSSKKQTFDYGYGRQYATEKEAWTIITPKTQKVLDIESIPAMKPVEKKAPGLF